MKRKLKYSLLLASTTALYSSFVLAATQNFTAKVQFSSPLTLTKVKDLDFGILKANQVGTYVLSTGGTVTPSGGGVVIGGTPQAGELLVEGSSTQTLNVSTSTFVSHNGVRISEPTCSYGGGAEVPCDTLNGQTAPGAGETLLVGATIDVNGTQSTGTTAAPSFNVNVVYN